MRICVNVICKKILKLSDYKEFPNDEYCIIYKELANKARRLPRTNNNSYIKMTPELLELCRYNASIELIDFLKANGYDTNISNMSNASNTGIRSNDSIKYKDTI